MDYASLDARNTYLRAVIDLSKRWARAVNLFHSIHVRDIHSADLIVLLDELRAIAGYAELLIVPPLDRGMHDTLVQALRAGVAYFVLIAEKQTSDTALLLEYERTLLLFSSAFNCVLDDIAEVLRRIAERN